MTRLTDEQIDNVVHDVRQALGDKAWYRHFADRIAALAVQEVERENDYWRTDAEEKSDRIASLTAQLTTANRSAAREALAKLALHMQPDRMLTVNQVLRWIDRAYPAAPSGETKCADVAGCDGKCCATPSPEAREVPEDVRVYVERKQHYPQVHDVATGDWVTITPADAKRIGILGGWRDA